MRAFQPPRLSLVASATLALWICLVASAAGQETGFASVENPYQHDYRFEVGDDLRPRVEVDGVQWNRFSIRPRTDREYPAAKPTPVFIEVDLRNTSDAADVLVIVLFEDERGAALDRLELSTIFVGRDRLKETVQKHKVTTSVLEATRNIYVFFEVMR
jgi:hypothetical protein